MFFAVWDMFKAVVGVFMWPLRKRLHRRLNKPVTWV